MTTSYQLTPAALADLDAIAEYTILKWGAEKMESYVLGLTNRCSWLGRNPTAGRSRTDIHPEYFCYPQGRHLVFYVLNSEGISIIGFPHQSMDIVSYFSQ